MRRVAYSAGTAHVLPAIQVQMAGGSCMAVYAAQLVLAIRGSVVKGPLSGQTCTLVHTPVALTTICLGSLVLYKQLWPPGR